MGARRAFDPAILFERWRPDPALAAYANDKEELDAVQAGKKAMLLAGFPVDYIAEGGRDFVALLRAAFRRGLAVTLYSRGEEPDVYVLPLDQTWRISALNALHETAFVEGRWTLAAEAQVSLLLGYDEAQRDAWLASVRQRQPAYGCLTMYTLLTRAQRARVAAFGHRCFGVATEVEGLELFFHRQHESLKRTAARLVPKGLTLARVGLDWRAAEPIFGSLRRARGLIRTVLTKRTARTLTRSLRSNVQLLTSAGWR